MQKIMSLLVLVFVLGVLTSVEFGQGSRVGGYSGRSCLESEKQALRQFKRGLFDEYNYLSSWVGDDCCSWHGISCDNTSTGHVIELDVRNCSLRGDQILNSSLLDLKYLTYLDLSFNNFSGNKIPDFFGSFKELTYLNLSSSNFQGLVPHHLGNLSTLRHLDLSNNYDSSLSIDSMRWLHGLSFLEHLDLSSVTFWKAVADSFPAINMLPNSILVLKLYHCELHDNIFNPLSFMNLTSLVTLDLGGNQFNHSFPLWVVNNSGLVNLNLGGNNFQGPIPEFVGSLTFLSELDLSFNNFQGLIPKSLGNLKSLSTLDLSVNHIEGLIPKSLGNLKSLSTLDLSYNRLDDSIPSELLGNLTKLTQLRIYSSQLIGCLPESICHLSELEALLVGDNKLSGNIPKCIGELSNLIVLDLYSNYWDGFVSEHHFINLKRLNWLTISSKSNLVLNISSEWIPPFQLQAIWTDSLKVGPSFPRWLQTQKEIEDFRMQNSSLSIIPTNWFVNLVSHAKIVDLSNNDINEEQLSFSLTPQDDLILEILSLSNNNLSGDFPVFICNLTSLSTLILSRNNLSGKLPKCLGNLKNLTNLDVMDNSLSGDIPVSLGSLGNLEYLNLNNNKFQGKLPLSFRNLSKLVILDAGKNHLIDTLPLWTREQLPFLSYLILRSNSLHGEIPTQLCQHSSIQILNLAQNKITGSIPPCFGNFSSMITGDSTEIDLDQLENGIVEMITNNVKGCELQYTSTLEYLFSIDLSNNRISGEIPEELMDLHALTNLNLTGNRLAGRIPEKIGELYKLESLDLSKNELTGPVPQNLSELNSLGSLNLSFNDLSGRIPTGRHLETFNDLSIYAGNKQLCGQAILKPCPGDTKSDSLHNHSEVEPDFCSDDERLWFYAGIGPGVLVGFLGFCASLHFIKSWRYFYFHHVEKVFDKIVVTVALLQRKIINRFFMKL